MNLTPASSSDLPSEAIFTRVSESGTRLMQTAIFTYSPQWRYTSLFQSARKQTWELDAGNHVERSVLASCDASEIGTQAHLHAARHAGREPPLDRRARLGRVLRERAEVEVAVVQHVPDHRAQLKLAPAERERRVRDGVVGEATGRVRLVAPEPLPPHVARVEGGAERRPARQGEHGQGRAIAAPARTRCGASRGCSGSSRPSRWTR